MQGVAQHIDASGTEPYVPRILVVDDEPSICAIVRKTLIRDPYAVETLTSSLDALERLREKPFDLLITDINMPDLDGLALAEQARVEHPLLGIVIMTAYGSFENISRALHTGIADFLTKPFDINDMRLTVTRALERQRLQRDNVRLQTLVNILGYSQAINSTLELGSLTRIVADIVTQDTGATVVALWLASGDQLQLQPNARLGPELRAAAEQQARAAFSSGTTARADADGGTTLLALPLVALDERIGALLVGYGGHPEPVTVELLSIVANQSGLALHNALQFAALRELDRLKSEFIGIASHELRTPLSLVLGYSSLLRNRLSGRERDSLQQIINGAIRIGDIVDDLVHLRRSDLREQQLIVASVNIWEVLREVVTELQSLATERGITLRLQCPDEPTLLQADREKLSVALAHLVDNATKFTAPGGLVTVRGFRPAPPVQPDVLIEVQDSGIGIAPRDLSRVFERFYQVAPSATRSQTGLGVGLAITKMFVELHGGQVQVQSELGHGSVFQVRLPVAR